MNPPKIVQQMTAPPAIVREVTDAEASQIQAMNTSNDLLEEDSLQDLLAQHPEENSADMINFEGQDDFLPSSLR